MSETNQSRSSYAKVVITKWSNESKSFFESFVKEGKKVQV